MLATDAKFDEPINPDQKDRKLRLATNRWCTKWRETFSRGGRGSNGECSAANVVLMNDVDMVIEIAKELGWKDDLKPVAVFGSKAWLDNPYNPSRWSFRNLMFSWSIVVSGSNASNC